MVRSAKRSAWSTRLNRVVRPIDAEELRTLAEARAYIVALPVERSSRQQWQHAIVLLLEAAQSRDAGAATEQLERALFLDMRLRL